MGGGLPVHCSLVTWRRTERYGKEGGIGMRGVVARGSEILLVGTCDIVEDTNDEVSVDHFPTVSCELGRIWFPRTPTHSKRLIYDDG